ncbi:hypothetical protein E2C01_012237 [Portunus trituberculatus]|uniref:Uncharacterized protein n=1 Tax=Portunus trituberculatus TaxID=210409 RepID=A0A5B7DE31_PORTR|nr:hypothetical protein [Portunus trituberculatus]
MKCSTQPQPEAKATVMVMMRANIPIRRLKNNTRVDCLLDFTSSPVILTSLHSPGFYIGLCEIPSAWPRTWHSERPTSKTSKDKTPKRLRKRCLRYWGLKRLQMGTPLLAVYSILRTCVYFVWLEFTPTCKTVWCGAAVLCCVVSPAVIITNIVLTDLNGLGTWCSCSKKGCHRLRWVSCLSIE